MTSEKKKYSIKHMIFSRKYAFLISGVIITSLLVYSTIQYQLIIPLIKDSIENQITIRVNTYRRLNQLENFVKFYDSCKVIKSIQVVWSDQENQYPSHWIKKFNLQKVEFEIHLHNSLTNRFKPILNISTQAVLSIDDDLIVPCEELENTLKVWQSNLNTIVGYSPRIHSKNVENGRALYNRWQHTWWNGIYSIMLTKIAIFHRKYLDLYVKNIPENVNNFINLNRNCEDLAMAHIIADECKCAPVWVNAIVYEVSDIGISGSPNHFLDRGKCLDYLQQSLKSWPWTTGYQKLIRINVLDYFNL